MTLQINVKSPEDCNENELSIFEALVSEGGEVSVKGLRKRILRAQKLVFIKDQQCVAVGAIKNPNDSYREKVFTKSKSTADSDYPYELGWLYVSESSRGKGYGRLLMQAISNYLSGDKCFATTREDNDSMYFLLSEFGFQRMGQPYQSTNGEYQLLLYGN